MPPNPCSAPRRAIDSGAFAAEIAPVTVKGRKGETRRRQRRNAIHSRPRQDPDAEARVPQGRHGDRGGLVLDFGWRRRLVLMRESTAKRRGLKPLARVVGYAARARAGVVHHRARGRHPEAARRSSAGRRGGHLYEVNEAFAVVTMAAMRELDHPARQVNVNGGACALGHPIGATGARIVATLVRTARARRQARHGVVMYRRRRSDRDGH